jgi:hypothetical protein
MSDSRSRAEHANKERKKRKVGELEWRGIDGSGVRERERARFVIRARSMEGNKVFMYY